MSLTIRRKTAQQAGFTLVELLVVMSIIGVLISLMLPALSTAKSQAEAVSCSGNMHQVYLLVMQYALDHEGNLPRANSANIATFKADFTLAEDLDAPIPQNAPSGNWIDYYMRSSNIPPDIWYCPALMRNDPSRIPERWMDADTNQARSYSEFKLGMAYCGNPTTGSLWKFKKAYPIHVDTMTSADPLIFDYCLAPRPTPIQAEDVEDWRYFPHLSVLKARFTNMIMGDGSLYRKPIEDMSLAYTFINPTNIFW